MQDLDQLPLEQWAAQLKQAREAAKLEFSHVAQELRLSAAQLRGIETGTITAFHGPGYYLRAVEKYAQQLGITLDPPVTELELTDSQLALKRVKNTPTASNLAKNQENLLGASAMPRAMRRSRIGLWLGAILLALVATGTWMAFVEGWPNGDETTLAQTETTERKTQTNSDDASSPDTVSAVKSESATSRTDSSTSNELALPNTTTTPSSVTGLKTPALTQSATDAVSVGIPATESLPAPEIAAETTSETTSETVPEPAPQPPAPPPPDVIEVSFTDDCWVEVRRIDGTTEQGIYKPGQTLTVPVDDLDRLSFGNAQAANATRGGDPFDVIAFTRGGNNVARIPGDELR